MISVEVQQQTSLQQAFGVYLVHRAWLHLLKNKVSSDWDAMDLLKMASARLLADRPEDPEGSSLVVLAFALSSWREGRFPERWEEDFSFGRETAAQ